MAAGAAGGLSEARPAGGVPAGLRRLFKLHWLVAGLLGLQHLLAPRMWTTVLGGVSLDETATWRAFGAALFVFAYGSSVAAREDEWDRVRIVVAMQALWSALATLVVVWGIFEGYPPREWIKVGLLGAFAVGFGWYYLRREPSGSRREQARRRA